MKESSGQADQTPSQPTLAKASSQDDLLWRALHRAKVKRRAIFGVSEIAADDILAGYLIEHSASDGLGEVEQVNKLEGVLKELGGERPEAMRLLRYLLHRATGFIHPAKVSADPQPEAAEAPAEGETDKSSSAPDSYDDIEVGTPFYNACQTSITHRLHPSSCYHYNSYFDIAEDVTTMIAEGATRAWVRQFLATGAYGRFTPSPNPAREVDKLVDECYEIVLHVKEEFRAGWKVRGKNEASYFGRGRIEEQQDGRPSGQRNYWRDDDGQAKKETVCCRRQKKLPQHGPLPKNNDDRPFRCMDLPPELRNLIYRRMLAPGTVSLVSCAHHNPRGTAPGLVPSILATSKHVREEAADLLFENTFVANLHPSAEGFPRPALHRGQLPLHVLPKVKNLVLVVDSLRFTRPNCDWTPLQALTSLKTLHITAIEEEKRPTDVEDLTIILTEIIRRIPATCEVHYGCSMPMVERFVHYMSDVLTQKPLHDRSGERIEETAGIGVARLKAAAENVSGDVIQGAKSGEALKSRSLPGD